MYTINKSQIRWVQNGEKADDFILNRPLRDLEILLAGVLGEIWDDMQKKFDKIDVVQTVGQSVTKVMSQKAVTDLINGINSSISSLWSAINALQSDLDSKPSMGDVNNAVSGSSVEFASQAEVTAGSVDNKAVSPKTLQGGMLGGKGTKYIYKNGAQVNVLPPGMHAAAFLGSIKYQNTTNRPIFVTVTSYLAPNAANDFHQLWMQVESSGIAAVSNNAGMRGTLINCHAVVPPGDRYAVCGQNVTIHQWMELR